MASRPGGSTLQWATIFSTCASRAEAWAPRASAVPVTRARPARMSRSSGLPTAATAASAKRPAVESGRARISCRMASPSAVLVEIAAPSVANGHGTVVPTRRSPKSQSDEATGLVPRIATT